MFSIAPSAKDNRTLYDWQYRAWQGEDASPLVVMVRVIDGGF